MDLIVDRWRGLLCPQKSRQEKDEKTASHSPHFAATPFLTPVASSCNLDAFGLKLPIYARAVDESGKKRSHF